MEAIKPLGQYYFDYLKESVNTNNNDYSEFHQLKRNYHILLDLIYVNIYSPNFYFAGLIKIKKPPFNRLPKLKTKF